MSKCPLTKTKLSSLSSFIVSRTVATFKKLNLDRVDASFCQLKRHKSKDLETDGQAHLCDRSRGRARWWQLRLWSWSYGWLQRRSLCSFHRLQRAPTQCGSKPRHPGVPQLDTVHTAFVTQLYLPLQNNFQLYYVHKK